jgi:hypothetical protein
VRSLAGAESSDGDRVADLAAALFLSDEEVRAIRDRLVHGAFTQRQA